MEPVTLDTITCSDVLTYLTGLPDDLVNCVVTSPPYYGLRDYGGDGQIGAERTVKAYVDHLVAVFREIRRVLRADGTVWLNLGDSYAGSWGNYHPTGQGGQRAKHTERWARPGYENQKSYRPPASYAQPGLKAKDLMLIPARLAIALCDDGWWIRAEIVWNKPSIKPESVQDRPTRCHEMIYLLTKQPTYYYDQAAIREPARDWGTRDRSKFRGGTTDPKLKHHGLTDSNNKTKGRNKRSVWTVPTANHRGSHYATFPAALIEPMIKAGCPEGGIVLDPFMGSGTTALVARALKRHYLGCDLNPKYVALARERLRLPFEKHHLPAEDTLTDLPLFQGSTGGQDGR